jgi:hypothetical protein
MNELWKQVADKYQHLVSLMQEEIADLRSSVSFWKTEFEVLKEVNEAVSTARTRLLQEMDAVWKYLQTRSPWSPPADMDWSYEIICRIDELLEQIDNQIEYAKKQQSEIDYLRKVVRDRVAKLEKLDDYDHLFGALAEVLDDDYAHPI